MDEEEREWNGGFDPFSDPEEKRVLFATLDSFSIYRQVAHHTTTHKRRQAFYALPSAQWQSLASAPISYLDTLIAIDDAIDVNSLIANEIFTTALDSFNLPPHQALETREDLQSLDWRKHATPEDVSKANTIIRQFYRDWSAEGRVERDKAYGPVLAALQAEFPSNRNATRVLVPGAGLGRLAFEICLLGFGSEGNEISYHALFASSWVLNHVPADGKRFGLYPWLGSFANQVSRENQLQRVEIPDIHPGTALDSASESEGNQRQGGMHAFERLKMSAGDFSVVYSDQEHKGLYDAVVTVFFIDTAPNLIAYVETVHDCLKDGGVWINLGPLLWHFGGDDATKTRPAAHSTEHKGPGPSQEEVRDDKSKDSSKRSFSPYGAVELSNDEVLALISAHGFTIEKQEVRPGGDSVGYIQQPKSMMQSNYRVAHWVARKTSSTSK